MLLSFSERRVFVAARWPPSLICKESIAYHLVCGYIYTGLLHTIIHDGLDRAV
jgi:hypothetical protein